MSLLGASKSVFQLLSKSDSDDSIMNKDTLRSASTPYVKNGNSPEKHLSSITLYSTIEGELEESQKTTFTNWFNDCLAGKYTISDLWEDLQDGLLLIRLLENLTQKKIWGCESAPKLTAHKMVNLDLALKFLKEEGVKLIGIGSHNIYQGDHIRILGLIWSIIQKYQLRLHGGHVSTKAIMIEWLQAIISRWNIHNLTTDWSDGRALIALVREIKPGAAKDVDTLDPNNNLENCTIGIKAAQSHLKIPPIISPEDLSRSKIDEKSMMTYLSYFCGPARTKLLKWLRKMLPQIKITDFTTTWTDGKVFAALLNACFPGLFSDWAKLESENAIENNEAIIALTKKKLGVEPSFSAKELATSEIEELQVMTYIMRIKNSSLLPLPEEIVVSGPGLMTATVGKETHFQIDTTKAGPGNLLIEAFYEDDSSVNFKLHEKHSGIITLTYTPHAPGTIQFDILWSDEQVPNSPFSVPVTDSNLVRILDSEHLQTTVLVNDPIELSLDTKFAGSGAVTAYLKYNKMAPIDAVVTTLEDSIVKLQITPTKVGRAVLHILWEGQELVHLATTYEVVDSENYQISSVLEDEVYRVYTPVNFDISTKGSPLSALKMVAVRENESRFPITFQNIDKNLGIATFTPTMPGAYQIKVTCAKKLIPGSPIKVRVTDPSRCKILGQTPENLKSGDTFTMNVYTKDAGPGTLAFECTDRETSSLFETVVSERGNDGAQSIEVTPLEEGEFIVAIQFNGTDIPHCPFRVRVCDPSNCQVSEELLDLKSGIAGKTLRFQVFVNNPDSIFTPTIKASGPSAKYTPVIRKTDARTYSVQLAPWEVGINEISVLYGDYHINNSPFFFAVDSLDSNNFSATGLGLQEAYTGVPAQFVVLSKREGLLDDGTLQIKVTGVVNNNECKVRVKDNGNGTYNAAYLVETPGAYLISVTAEGKDIPGSPFKLNAQHGPDAAGCRMYGPAIEPNAILTIGKPIEFSVDTKNGGVGKLSVKSVGPGGEEARVFIAKAERREYAIRLDPIKAGKYRTTVMWSGKNIPGSPFLLKIYPGPDASKCKAYGPGLEDGELGNPSHFTIETRNAGAGILTVRLHGVRNAFKVDIKPVSPQDVRTLKAKYDPRKAGEYLITIKWSETHIPGSPFRVKIVGEEQEVKLEDIRKAIPLEVDLDPIMEVDLEDEPEGHPARKLVTKKPKSTPARSLPAARRSGAQRYNHDTHKSSRSADAVQLRKNKKKKTSTAKMLTRSETKLTQAKKRARSGSAPVIRGEFQGKVLISMDKKDPKKHKKHKK